jgi:two-component system, NarL family, response regulator
VVQTLKATSVVPIRLVYVAKHRLVREGLVRSIATQPDLRVVGEASDPNDAVHCFLCHEPDVTLVDLRWCGMAGVDAVRGVRSLSPTARIVAIARSPADYTTLLAMDAGVMGFVGNGSGLRELLRVIRAVHRGRPALPRGIDDALRARSAHRMLTPRQIEILQLIGGGFGNEAISLRLQISQQTVKAHVKAILARMQARDRTHALSLGVRRGIVHLDP